MAGSQSRSLVLGCDCGLWRRRLGPIAWSVLEELVSIGEGSDGVVWANVSVRMLAVRLGLSKDTVNRAIRRLERAGLVVPGQVGHGDRGRFTTPSYRVELARLPMRIASERAAEPAAPRARRRPLAPVQLSLLDAE
jgi:DNA-binding transcriptional ArsR family regulator